MLRLTPTGQTVGTLRALALTILFSTLSSGSLLAQKEAQGTTATLSNTVKVAPVASPASRAPVEASAPLASEASSPTGAPNGAANPAPEPNTLMLLGTGTVVLLLLYTRRRIRSPVTEVSQA